VAMGSAADMAVHPAFALLVGSIAGTVSVFGFSTLQGIVENKLRIHDTCGVLNLHGIPGVIGGIVSIIASAAATGNTYDHSQLAFIWAERDGRTAAYQAKLQLGFLIITLGISSISGLFCGILLSRMPYPKRFFLDNTSWETPSREVPYFFDKRGEARHSSEAATTQAPAGAASQGAVVAEGMQINDLQNKVAYLENMLRSQRKTLRDQARAIESIGGGPVRGLATSTSTIGGPGGLAGSMGTTPRQVSPRFGNLEPEESSSLLSGSQRMTGNSGVYAPNNNNNNSNNNNNNNNFNNLASMLENLATKVNFLVENQTKDKDK